MKKNLSHAYTQSRRHIYCYSISVDMGHSFREVDLAVFTVGHWLPFTAELLCKMARLALLLTGTVRGQHAPITIAGPKR